MFSKTARILAPAVILAALCPIALGQDDLTADQIVEKANLAAYYQGDDGRSVVNMKITDGQGRVRTREFIILRKDGPKDGQDQKFYVYFLEPSDVARMTYLVWKHVGRDDDRWLYAPGLDLVKRIAASDERTSFVGSHFYYEDVSGRGVEEDEHSLMPATENHYVIKNVPKDKNAVEFSWYKVYIDKKSFLPLKAIYYEKNDEEKSYRIVEALEVKIIQGFPTVVQSRVRDLASGGNTVTEFSKIKYNVDLRDALFTQRYLKRTPPAVREMTK